jgi:hypothetical protein
MRERSGRQDVTERSGPSGLARRASRASATTESGGEAEKAGGSGQAGGWARAAQLAEPERASHSGAAAPPIQTKDDFDAPGWKSAVPP